MKKFRKTIFIIALISTIVFVPYLAKAISNNISVSYSITPSSSSVIVGSTVNVSVNVTGASSKLASSTITLNYDSSKFEYISYSAPSPAGPADSSVSPTPGRIIYLYSDNLGGLNAINSGTVVTFSFRVLNNVGTGNFSFTASGAADANGQTYNIVNNSGSTSVNVTQAPVISSNNYLSSITVAGGTFSPAFNKTITTYNVTVDAPDTTISATAEDGTAYVDGTGYTTLRYGVNTFYVTCTAANGATRTYILNITRPVKGSTDTSLLSLSVSDTNISYNGGLYYSATVDNSVKKVTINAKASDNKTTLTGTGTFNLSVGNNTFVITAVSESGISTSYTIVITRNSKGFGADKDNDKDKDKDKELDIKGDNNYLKSLEITGANFKFDRDNLNYFVTVPFTQELLEVNYETESPNATVNIVFEGNLVVGSNTVFIEVTAENGEKRTYQVIITRNDEVPITEYNTDAIIAALDAQGEVVVAVNANFDTLLLDDAVVAKLKETEKMLTIKFLDEYGNIQNAIIINGKYITSDASISFNLVRNITDKILLEALDSDYVSVNTKGSNIPEHTKFRHYIDSVKNKYILYYLDGKKVINENLEITNGYVEIEVGNNANYAIVKLKEDEKEPEKPKPAVTPTPKKKKSNKSKWFILGGGVLALAGGAVGALYIVKKKKTLLDGSEVEYLDLEPENNSVAAPAVENSVVDTIPAMDTLDIDVETLSTEPAVEMLSIPEPSITPKDETTGAKENYHYEWQKEYFTKKEQEEKIKADLNDLLDPKYEIKPILSAEAIADTFVDVKIDFDFEPISSASVVVAPANVETLETTVAEPSKN